MPIEHDLGTPPSAPALRETSDHAALVRWWYDGSEDDPDESGTCSLAEWLELNAEGMTDEEVARLMAGDRVTLGGGAMPLSYVERLPDDPIR